jgi:hypothetical protein
LVDKDKIIRQKASRPKRRDEAKKPAPGIRCRLAFIGTVNVPAIIAAFSVH